MFTVVPMSGKLYPMKFDGDFADLVNDDEEQERVHAFLNQGQPVVFCEDLEDLAYLFNEEREVEEVIESD